MVTGGNSMRVFETAMHGMVHHFVQDAVVPDGGAALVDGASVCQHMIGRGHNARGDVVFTSQHDPHTQPML
jgi:hypothetical protein